LGAPIVVCPRGDNNNGKINNNSMQKIALSLTGSGHLFVYQLGALKVLIDAVGKDGNAGGVVIDHVSGSSGGAIAATVMSLFPTSLTDFARDFIQRKGSGLRLLRDHVESITSLQEVGATLSICTTRCHDGQAILFPFTAHKERLIKYVEASCTIPPSFHPVDLLSSSAVSTYPDDDGITIDGTNYVDGGIAAPAPPTPQGFRRVVISPVSGCCTLADDMICPAASYRFFTIKIRGGFRVNPSVPNLRVLRASTGLTTSTELQSYYDMGQQDGETFVHKLSLE
jgi:predicted acylesterase/phospholipase RssA